MSLLAVALWIMCFLYFVGMLGMCIFGPIERAMLKPKYQTTFYYILLDLQILWLPLLISIGPLLTPFILLATTLMGENNPKKSMGR